jgi:hypothetical protein
MSPEDRIANLWKFHASFMVEVMVALRSEGVLSADAIEQMLQSLENDYDFLEGEQDQQLALQSVDRVRRSVDGYQEQHGLPLGSR